MLPLKYPSSIVLSPNDTLCVGCWKPHSKMDCYTGKVNKGIHFASKTTEELVWNPLTNQDEIELVEKRFPIDQWAKGFICRKCASSYKTITHTRKDGSVWYEPMVKLDESPTLRTTLNQGESREIKSRPDDGFGTTRNLAKEEIHVSSFNSFMHRSKGSVKR